MQAINQQKRDDAYAQGEEEAPELFQNPSFRDFVNMYLGEGSKTNRNMVAIVNSNAKVMLLSQYWLKRLTTKPLQYSVQIHIDHDEAEIQGYWGKLLDVEPDKIKIQRKSNSGQLAGRKFRSQYGVLTIRVSDTYLHARIKAWMHYLEKQWVDLR